jgi:hypothetical protein
MNIKRERKEKTIKFKGNERTLRDMSENQRLDLWMPRLKMRGVMRELTKTGKCKIEVKIKKKKIKGSIKIAPGPQEDRERDEGRIIVKLEKEERPDE